MDALPKGRFDVPFDSVQPEHQSIVLEDGAKLCTFCSQIPAQFWVTEPEGGETITATLQPLRTIRETAEKKECHLCYFLHARHRSGVWTDTVGGHVVSANDLPDTQEGELGKRRGRKLADGTDERFELTCRYGSVSSAKFYLYKAPSWWHE